MKRLEVYYYQNKDLTWDSYCEGQLIVKSAKTLNSAVCVGEIILNDEFGEYVMGKEVITYHL